MTIFPKLPKRYLTPFASLMLVLFFGIGEVHGLGHQASQEPNPTPQEIFAKYLEALGGTEKLEAVNSIRVTERIRSPNETTDLILVAEKEKWVLDYESSKTRNGFDGLRVWSQKSGKAAVDSNLDHYPFTDSHPISYPLNLAGAVDSYRFVDKIVVKDQEVYRLTIVPEKTLRPDRLVYPGPIELHFDVQTGLLRTAIYMGKRVEYEDYRAVGDIVVAHRRKLVVTMEGFPGLRGVWDVKSIEFNPELPPGALEPEVSPK